MEIRNKVKESSLIQMDLASFKPNCEIISIDLSEQLWKGLVLKEKDFRSWIKDTDWTYYKDKAVFIYCSTEAIIPTWAFMLVTASLNDICSISLVGSEEDLQRILIVKNIFYRAPHHILNLLNGLLNTCYIFGEIYHLCHILSNYAIAYYYENYLA